MLHKSKEDAEIDRRQRRAQELAGDAISHISDDDLDNYMEFFDNSYDATEIPHFAALEEEIAHSRDSDWYVCEALDANCQNGYFDTPSMLHDEDNIIHYSSLPGKELLEIARSFSSSTSNVHVHFQSTTL